MADAAGGCEAPLDRVMPARRREGGTQDMLDSPLMTDALNARGSVEARAGDIVIRPYRTRTNAR